MSWEDRPEGKGKLFRREVIPQRETFLSEGSFAQFSLGGKSLPQKMEVRIFMDLAPYNFSGLSRDANFRAPVGRRFRFGHAVFSGDKPIDLLTFSSLFQCVMPSDKCAENTAIAENREEKTKNWNRVNKET